MTRERAIHGFGLLLLIFAACLASASGTIAWIAEANPPVYEWASAAESQRLNAMNSHIRWIPPIVTLCVVLWLAWMAARGNTVAPAIADSAAEDHQRFTRLIMFVCWLFNMALFGSSLLSFLNALAAHTNGPMTNSPAFGMLAGPLGNAGLTCCILASLCLPMPSPTKANAKVDLDRPARGPIDGLVLKACRGFVRRCGAAGRFFRRMARTS